jgi:hypothetical protein
MLLVVLVTRRKKLLKQRLGKPVRRLARRRSADVSSEIYGPYGGS